MRQIVNVSVPVPEEVLLSLRVGSDEFALQMAMYTALKLYENQRLSIGQAAAFAEMDEMEFIRFLGQNRVSVFSSAADLSEDYQNA
jgi:predicted HTH domain antitoxin